MAWILSAGTRTLSPTPPAGLVKLLLATFFFFQATVKLPAQTHSSATAKLPAHASAEMSTFCGTRLAYKMPPSRKRRSQQGPGSLKSGSRAPAPLSTAQPALAGFVPLMVWQTPRPTPASGPQSADRSTPASGLQSADLTAPVVRSCSCPCSSVGGLARACPCSTVGGPAESHSKSSPGSSVFVLATSPQRVLPPECLVFRPCCCPSVGLGLGHPPDPPPLS